MKTLFKTIIVKQIIIEDIQLIKLPYIVQSGGIIVFGIIVFLHSFHLKYPSHMCLNYSCKHQHFDKYAFWCSKYYSIYRNIYQPTDNSTSRRVLSCQLNSCQLNVNRLAVAYMYDIASDNLVE